MADIKFGFGQLNNATPAHIARIKRALNFLSGGIVVFLPFIAVKLHTTSDEVSTWLGLFILTFNFVGLMFGVPISENESVPGSQVTEVETPVK